MGAGGHADRRLLRRQEGAEREARADALGDAHHVRRDPGPFMGEQLAGAAVAALDLVEEQQQAELVADPPQLPQVIEGRSEEHTSELQSLMRISYAVFCLKKKK